MSEDSVINFYMPVTCKHCPEAAMVQLEVEIPDDCDPMMAFRAGAEALDLLVRLHLMRHCRDAHNEVFVEEFRRSPEDIIPEAEALLEEMGIEHGEAIGFAAGGAISTTINYN